MRAKIFPIRDNNILLAIENINQKQRVKLDDRLTHLLNSVLHSYSAHNKYAIWVVPRQELPNAIILLYKAIRKHTETAPTRRVPRWAIKEAINGRR